VLGKPLVEVIDETVVIETDDVDMLEDRNMLDVDKMPGC